MIKMSDIESLMEYIDNDDVIKFQDFFLKDILKDRQFTLLFLKEELIFMIEKYFKAPSYVYCALFTYCIIQEKLKFARMILDDSILKEKLSNNLRKFRYDSLFDYNSLDSNNVIEINIIKVFLSRKELINTSIINYVLDNEDIFKEELINEDLDELIFKVSGNVDKRIKILLKYFKNINLIYEGGSLLHRYFDKNVMKMFIDKGIDLNILNNEGLNALEFQFFEGERENVELFNKHMILRPVKLNLDRRILIDKSLLLLIEGQENFHDFIQLNRHGLLRNSDDEAIDMLLSYL